MNITLQYFDSCPNWRTLDQRLTEATQGSSDVTVNYQPVETHEEAIRLDFHGSPTLRIEGIDPFADGTESAGLACRVYSTPLGPAGAPTIKQLRSVVGMSRQK